MNSINRINRKSEIETQTEDVKTTRGPSFTRMFSVESTVSNITGINNYYDLPRLASEYSLCSVVILFKITELVSNSFEIGSLKYNSSLWFLLGNIHRLYLFVFVYHSISEDSIHKFLIISKRCL